MTLASDQIRQAPAAVTPAVRRWRGRGVFSGWWLYLLLLGGLVLVVGPFVWMVLGSFKPNPEFLRSPPTWIPEAPTFENYRRLFDELDFPRFFTNSAVVATAVTAGNLVFCSMVGYALAKLRFYGRDKLFVLILATMMIPGSVTVIPLYVLMAGLGLTNNYGGLILPFLATAFGVFLMRQFMLSIPDELLEAARIDGASELRIFWQVVFPLATPALATLGILSFLGSWNSFFWPLIIATDDDMFTLPVALATFATGQYQAEHGLLMAGSVVIILPVLIVFILLQRLFTEGIATTGIKG
jgi:multiple sugar transport system permease protein